jgi:glycine cleavage system H protein
MPEFLETILDKFTFRVAKDRLYSREGIWVLPEQTPERLLLRLGVTDFLQQRSGDVAFIHHQPVGARLAEGESIAELETIKVTLDLLSPATGAIVEVNRDLEKTPEIINQDPYGKGWVAVLHAENWETCRLRLLDPETYQTHMESQAKEEL